MASGSRLGAALARRGGMCVLDGGMGTGLVSFGLTEQECWTAGDRCTDARIRECVLGVYAAYLQAGADILTVNTYNVSAAKYFNRGASAAGRAGALGATMQLQGADRQIALHEQGLDESTTVSADTLESALAKETEHLNANFALAREAVALHAQSDPSAPVPLLAASLGGFSTSILSRAETANRLNADENSLAAERVR